MSLIRLHLKATVNSRSDANDFLQRPGDAVLVERGSPRWLLMMCPCGCNEVVPINLDARSGPAWECYGKKDKGITIFPSVWRDTGCESHFIIWYGRILLFDDSHDYEPIIPGDVLGPLIERVQERLSEELVHFRQIARSLDAIPWDVQYACRHLVRAGRAREGSGKQRDHFARPEAT